MKTKIHAAAGGLAFLIIASFWTSTVLSETFGGPEDIVLVKTAILYGMGPLIPALMITGRSCFSLGRSWNSPVIAAKTKRMRLIAGARDSEIEAANQDAVFIGSVSHTI